MRAADEVTFAVEGRAVRVRVSGAGSPVLLLHGIARSLEDWSAAHDLLASNHRVISADLPGFGFTRAFPGRPGLSAFARAMVGLLDAVGVEEPAHVMGNSLGGGVAMTMAAEHRDRVASLVLVDSVGFGREVNLSPLPMTYAVLAGLPLVGKRFAPLAREAGAQVCRDQFFDPSYATPEMIRHYGRVGRQPDFRNTFLGTAFGIGVPMVGLYPGWRRRLLEQVRDSGVPVLVVWGEADSVLPASHLDAARRALPDAQFHLFGEAGHMPQIEKAEDFVALASEFVAKASS
ncbi:MAG: alpha/beta fold hydrolase [Nocardioidaceae bacterium]|nr:alpha/beta fold hydrolase [Nocardioidaceae bacterium]